MGYWKSKVVPKIKKVFEKNTVKKTDALEACKSFDGSKEEYTKELEEKKTELQPKVIEIYEASPVEIKALVKEPKNTGLKKHSAGVEKFLEELVKIDFPGSKAAHEACSKCGAALVPGPILFVLDKVSTFIITEEKKEVETSKPEEETSEKDKEREAGIEQDKKEVVVVEPPKP